MTAHGPTTMPGSDLPAGCDLSATAAPEATTGFAWETAGLAAVQTHARGLERRLEETEAQLHAMEAQAARSIRDLRVLYDQERARRRELKAAYKQQLRILTDLKAEYRAEAAGRREVQRVYVQTLHVLAHTVELRDRYTGGHLERVRAYSLAMAAALGLGDQARHDLEMGALLHDLGKIGVPDLVLGKPGTLTGPERELMESHVAKGAELLGDLPFMQPAVAAVGGHHERWDGAGYPHRLAGEAIPLLGRIVAIADAFDAMTTNRAYRKALPLDVATGRLAEGRGAQFDPELVPTFLETLATGQVALPTAARRSA